MDILAKLRQSAKQLNKNRSKTIVFPESTEERTLKAVSIILKEKISNVILVGDSRQIAAKLIKLKINLSSHIGKTLKIIDNNENIYEYSLKLYELRKDKGMTVEQAKKLLQDEPIYYGAMLLKLGKADGMISGAIHPTAHTLRPAFQIIKAKKKLASGCFIMDTSLGNFIFADCGVNIMPDAEELAEIAVHSAESYRQLIGGTPKVAMLSFSTKGSAEHEILEKIRKAVQIAKKINPKLTVDGEMQLDAAIVPEVAKMKCPDSRIKGNANVLVFPDLNAGNIGYKLVERFGKARAVGPIVQGLNKPVNDLSRGCSVQDIVDMAAVTVLQAARK